jgi:hypothetical protein
VPAVSTHAALACRPAHACEGRTPRAAASRAPPRHARPPARPPARTRLTLCFRRSARSTPRHLSVVVIVARSAAQAFISVVEGFNLLLAKNPNYKPGDLLGASEYMDADDRGWQRYQLAELNNGRYGARQGSGWGGARGGTWGRAREAGWSWAREGTSRAAACLRRAAFEGLHAGWRARAARRASVWSCIRVSVWAHVLPVVPRSHAPRQPSAELTRQRIPPPPALSVALRPGVDLCSLGHGLSRPRLAMIGFMGLLAESAIFNHPLIGLGY